MNIEDHLPAKLHYLVASANIFATHDFSVDDHDVTVFQRKSGGPDFIVGVLHNGTVTVLSFDAVVHMQEGLPVTVPDHILREISAAADDYGNSDEFPTRYGKPDPKVDTGTHPFCR